MSVVYRGLDGGGKRVAVQVLQQRFAPYGELILREIRARSLVSHPNLAEVRDSGVTPEGEPFFVLEHLSGTTLEDVLDREAPFPWPRALRIADQIALGLSALHASGSLHLDLKPENVMLLAGFPDERVKVLDLFGYQVARVYAEREGIEAAWGTPEYMSPEVVAQRQGVDQRADVYALGVSLFDMLTGARPFAADTPRETMELVRRAPPPGLAEAHPEIDLPAGLEALVQRMMAKDPARRPPTMEDFREELTTLLLSEKLR